MNSQHIVTKLSFWKGEFFNIISRCRCKSLPAANEEEKVRLTRQNQITNLNNINKNSTIVKYNHSASDNQLMLNTYSLGC